MRTLALLMTLAACSLIGSAQVPTRGHPAIQYTARETRDPVAALNRKLQNGTVKLLIDNRANFIRSLLEALDVPLESQVLVFSKTSAQRQLVGPRTPRAIYFNDSVAVASVPGSSSFEVAAVDPEKGVIFYTLRPRQAPTQQFTRDDSCLICHQSAAMLRVPGLGVASVETEPDGTPRSETPDYITDHRSPLEHRWGGWYVTGNLGSIRHMGRVLPKDGTVNPAMHPSLHSDVAALMVLEHQTHMTNLLTRFGWQSRAALHESAPLPAPDDLVDYMFFVDEALLAGKIEGASGFAEKFSARGPRDSKDRSLRELDLERRLFRYPCSYLIYTEAFDGLPTEARELVYRRMWLILSGQEKSEKYQRLSITDRQTIVEILRDTKKGLPDYFKPVL